MQINIIRFSSILNKSGQSQPLSEDLFYELRKYFQLRILAPEDMSRLSSNDFAVIYIETGGVEYQFIQHFEELPRPILLLANDRNNSLPAAMEISACLRQEGAKYELLYGETDEIVRKLQLYTDCFTIQHSFIGKKIGVIGTPSSWLIASSVDYLIAKRRWGVEYTDIPLKTVFSYYSQTKDKDVEADTEALLSHASISHECTPQDVVKAMRLYHALRRICQENDLKALTLSCFKILERLSVSGCLALSLLNDEGIVSGCEGDLQAIFSMLFAKEVSGSACFMGNISSIRLKENEISMAHCTIGTHLTDKFCLRSHFESNKSVAVQGWVPEKGVTVLRCGGECLDEYFLSSGTILENTDYPYCCRTQLRIKLDSPVDYFLKRPLGNHHIIVPLDASDKLNVLLQYNGCKRIE